MPTDFNDIAITEGPEAILEAIQNAQAPEPPKRRRLKPYSLSEIGELPTKEYLVKHLLDTGAFSIFYGEPNCGKTFLVLNLCFAISAGRKWLGKRVKQGNVLYIACEGGQSIRDRITAGKISGQLKDDSPFFLLPASVNFYDEDADIEELLEEISLLPERPSIIVVDTVSRALAGGDENSSAGMGGFIKNCDRIRQETGAHLLAVHHSGKDEAKGARGHSSLKAAVDTEVLVSKASEGGLITAKVMKQRDGATGEAFRFQLDSINVRFDEDRETVTSCVLQPASYDAKPKLSGQAGKALDLLQCLIAERGEEYFPEGSDAHVKAIRLEDFKVSLQKVGIATSDKPDTLRKSFVRILDKLKNENIAMTSDDYIWLADNSDNAGQN